MEHCEGVVEHMKHRPARRKMPWVLCQKMSRLMWLEVAKYATPSRSHDMPATTSHHEMLKFQPQDHSQATRTWIQGAELDAFVREKALSCYCCKLHFFQVPCRARTRTCT